MAKQNGKPRCRETNADGDPCRNPVVLDSGYCVAHDPDNREQLLRQSRRGGEVTRRMFEAGLHDLPPLDSPAAAQDWLARIAKAAALNRLSASAAQAARSSVRDWLKAYEAGEQADRLARLEARLEELQKAGVLG